MAILGGPANKVTVVTDGRKRLGGAAIPVAVVAGRAIEGDRSTPVYIVTSGPVQGGPALPVVNAPIGAATTLIEGGPAVPVFVVSGSLS